MLSRSDLSRLPGEGSGVRGDQKQLARKRPAKRAPERKFNGRESAERECREYADQGGAQASNRLFLTGYETRQKKRACFRLLQLVRMETPNAFSSPTADLGRLFELFFKIYIVTMSYYIITDF